MPSLKTIWENSMIQKHPIWTVIGIFIILLILDFQIITSFFSAWQRSEWLDLVAALLIAITLYLQSISTEKTARMEMAKVLTEAFSHSEMFEAIEYFLQVSPYLVDENGNDRQVYIQEINEKPETKKYRYQILTTLHHAERLYQKEKEAEKVLFTSLITPDIVEVTLCLYKLDDYMKEVDKPVYEMVYKVFEKVRTSYLKPYLDAFQNKKDIAPKRLQKTSRILSNLQAWDRQWGDEGDRILAERDLVWLDVIEASFSSEAFQTSLDSWSTLIQRFENDKSEVLPLKKRKVFAELYFYRGTAKHKLEDYTGAIEDYSKTIKLNPQNAYAYNNRGNAKEALKDYKGAIEDCNKAIKLNPQNAYAYNNRGNAKGKLNDYTGAIEDYNKAIEINPQYAKAYHNRGYARYNLKQYEEAIADFDKAIELDPNYANAYCFRGIAKYELKKYDKAIEDFTKLIELVPDFADAYNNRGNSKLGLKQYKEAITDYDKAIELNPQYADAYNNRGLTYQEMAQQARDNGNVTEAEELEAKAQADFTEAKRLEAEKQ